jgi:hypothetical protein
MGAHSPLAESAIREVVDSGSCNNRSFTSCADNPCRAEVMIDTLNRSGAVSETTHVD